jgi:hypothetical protein
MSIDLNADVGKIIKDLLSKKSSANLAIEGDKSVERQNYKSATLKIVLIFCAAAAIIWVINHFSQSPIEKSESEYKTVKHLQDALQQQELNIISTKNLLNINKKKASEILGEYSEIGGSKNLFNLISTIAERYSLTLINITKGATRSFNNPVPHNKITVLVELESSYPQYLKFKKELFEKKTILRVLSENIKLDKNPFTEKKLRIKLILEDYSIDKEGYEGIIAKNI